MIRYFNFSEYIVKDWFGNPSSINLLSWSPSTGSNLRMLITWISQWTVTQSSLVSFSSSEISSSNLTFVKKKKIRTWIMLIMRWYKRNCGQLNNRLTLLRIVTSYQAHKSWDTFTSSNPTNHLSSIRFWVKQRECFQGRET